MSTNVLTCGDSLEIIKTLPHARMIFCDVPDNLGAKYDNYVDKIDPLEYNKFLWRVISSCLKNDCDVFWVSCFYKYQMLVWMVLSAMMTEEFCDARMFIWRYTFGQHQTKDCGNGYRCLFRVSKKGVIWNTDAIRVPSARQIKYHDSRAKEGGRVPDDVWEFPRVCGTFREKRRWCPNQFPESLIERIVKMSTKEGDMVYDLFAGSGTVHRVCKKLNRDSISIDLSPFYIEKIAEEDMIINEEK